MIDIRRVFTPATSQVGLAFVCLCTIFAISAHSVLVLLVLFCASLLIASFVFDRADVLRWTSAFLFYACAATALFLIHLSTNPDYGGLTGGRGIGADDTYFFVLASPEPPLELTRLLSVSRPHYFMFTHNYSDLLSLVAHPVHKIFGVVHPLDLLSLNVAAMAFLPVLVARCARVLLDDNVAKVTWWLMLLCPFTLANSMILVRDGLTAVAFAAALLGVIERRFVLIVVGVLGAAYLRGMQGALLAGSIWVIAVCLWLYAKDAQSRPLWVGVLLLGAPLVLLAGSLVALPYLISNLDLVVGLFFREGFLQSWVSDLAAVDEGTSTFYAISQQPLPIRLPLAFAFYFGVPHLALDEVLGKPIFVPRDYLLGLFSVAFIVYVGLFARGVIRAWMTRHAVLLGIAAAYLLDVLLISQASMQVRHKVALMPMFYLLVAAGLGNVPSRVRTLGLLASAAVGAFTIIFNGYKFWVLPS